MEVSLAKIGVFHEQVQRLRLVDKIPSLAGHVDDVFHAQFPNSFVKFLQLLWNGIDLLDGTIMTHDFLFQFVVPKSQCHQIFQEVFVYHQ